MRLIENYVFPPFGTRNDIYKRYLRLDRGIAISDIIRGAVVPWSIPSPRGPPGPPGIMGARGPPGPLGIQGPSMVYSNNNQQVEQRLNPTGLIGCTEEIRSSYYRGH